MVFINLVSFLQIALISSIETPFSNATCLILSRCSENIFDEYLLLLKKKSAMSHIAGIAPIRASAV
jgi:hypothetical protein